jgi:hypothetical protein
VTAPTTYVAIIVSFFASVWCWYRIWRSDDPVVFKAIFTVMAVLPFVGPFLYLFADMPPRRRRMPVISRPSPKRISPFLKRWNEREHIYLAWASVVFWALAALAYWINDWRPGRVIWGRFGTYTEVDVLFFSLLIAAVLTFGAAVRAKVVLVRALREASNSAAPSAACRSALNAPTPSAPGRER